MRVSLLPTEGGCGGQLVSALHPVVLPTGLLFIHVNFGLKTASVAFGPTLCYVFNAFYESSSRIWSNWRGDDEIDKTAWEIILRSSVPRQPISYLHLDSSRGSNNTLETQSALQLCPLCCASTSEIIQHSHVRLFSRYSPTHRPPEHRDDWGSLRKCQCGVDHCTAAEVEGRNMVLFAVSQVGLAGGGNDPAGVRHQNSTS